MKNLIIVILVLYCIRVNAQDFGVSTLFQSFYDEQHLDNDNNTAVWKNDKYIMVWNKDFAWEDQIKRTIKGESRYTDFDNNGTYENIIVDTYYTENNLVYKFTIVDGTLVMVSTTTRIGSPIHFAGHIKSNIIPKPSIVNGEWVYPK